MARKNIVMIVTDDQGYGDFEATGNPHLKTPNLNRLYDNSVRLQDFHTDPMCAPTRAALMSGCYSFGVGVYSTLNGRYYMRDNVKTIAQYFKESGYRTGLFGKWHLGDTFPYRPEDRGFDTVASFGGGVIGETPDYWNNDYFDDVYRYKGINRAFDGYCTDIWFNLALGFVEDCKSDPFFCYIPTNAPHNPCNVDPKYSDPYVEMGIEEERANFYGMISNIDENVGLFISKLKDMGKLDDTIFVFFGDNGTSKGCTTDDKDHVISGYNGGMRGKKASAYEGSHRNLCLISSPDEVLGRSRDVFGITSQIDILPTFIDVCGLKGDTDKLDGVSLYDDLKSNSRHLNEDRELVVHCMQRDIPEKYKDFTVLKNRWRLVKPYYTGKRKPELYDLLLDPCENSNCADSHPEILSELMSVYEAWWQKRYAAALPCSRIPLLLNDEVIITCHAWHEGKKFCFDQKQIREGVDDNGFWSLEVLKDGMYEFELRRWPRESKLKLRDGCPSILKTCRTHFRPKGRSYRIVSSAIKIQDVKEEVPVMEDDEFSIIVVRLKKGLANLRTYFTMEDGSVIGSYYVYIRKIGNEV
ncbi:MAG: arylsulfatase [Sphaerochaeta sp.]